MKHSDPGFNQPFDISRMPLGTAPVPEAGWSAPATQASAPAQPSLSNIQWSGRTIDFQKLLLKYRLWVVCGVVAGLMLGHLVYRFLGAEYVATSKVLVSRRAAGPVSQQTEAETWGGRGEHISIIMSPLIVGQAIRTHELDRLPSLAASTDPIEDILDTLKVSRSAGQDSSRLNVIDVICRNPRREDSRAIVQAIIDAYGDYLKQTHEENIGELGRLVSRATTDLQQQISVVERDYEQFRATAPVFLRSPIRGPSGERISVPANVHQEKLEALDKERQIILVKRAELLSQLQSMDDALRSGRSREELAAMIQLFSVPQSKAGNAGPAAAMYNGGSGNAVTPDAQLIPLLMQERRLLLEYGPEWPELMAVREQLAALRDYYHQRGIALPGDTTAPAANGGVASGTGAASRGGTGNAPGASGYGTTGAAVTGSAAIGSAPLAQVPAQSLARTANGLDLIDVYRLSLQQELNGYGLREQEIDRMYADESTKARELGRFLEQDRRFNDDIDRLNGLWNAIQVDAAKFNIEKENLGYSLKVIAPAREELSLKRVIKLYGVGMVAVFGLLGGLIFLREWSDTTLKTIEEIRSSLPLPVLGAVPAFEAVAGHGGGPLKSALCYFHRPGSPAAEAYRSVRTALAVCLQDEQRVIQVTSPEPGDGKSTLIANLALAVAQSGRRVLLMDADLRKPTLHTLFGLRRNIGISEVVAGEIDLLDAAQPTVVDGLSVLTAGAEVASPAELLASSKFERLLSRAGSEYDVVLVDTPPLLAVSDPCIVAQRTDGLILVLRLARNRRAIARKAAELLQTNHVRVIGVVANGADADDDSYGYSYGYVTPETAARHPVTLKEQEEPVLT